MFFLFSSVLTLRDTFYPPWTSCSTAGVTSAVARSLLHVPSTFTRTWILGVYMQPVTRRHHHTSQHLSTFLTLSHSNIFISLAVYIYDLLPSLCDADLKMLCFPRFCLCGAANQPVDCSRLKLNSQKQGGLAPSTG